MKIYANPIAEYVDLLPNVLQYDNVEFDNTFHTLWEV